MRASVSAEFPGASTTTTWSLSATTSEAWPPPTAHTPGASVRTGSIAGSDVRSTESEGGTSDVSAISNVVVTDEYVSSCSSSPALCTRRVEGISTPPI
jgi:hypothetical protein